MLAPVPAARTLDRLSVIMFALVLAWLIASVYLVNIEFDDGYTTIVNSRYFLGVAEDYFWQRGPLLGFLLVPAEILALALGLHPLDVRVQHAFMVLIHFGYLLAVWRLLCRQFGISIQVLLAFVFAVLNVVFFSYAPFISHDIFPGLIALLMLRLADEYIMRPTWRAWVFLVALGTLAALVKHTYATIWIAVLLANAAVLALSGSVERHRWPSWVALCGAASLSGLVTWTVYAVVLSSSFADVPFWLRPYHQIIAFVDYFRLEGDIRDIIYQWVYIRNLSAYGVVACALVIPGIVLALQSPVRLLRTVAIAWVVLVVLMQLIAFKEVRYLSYLAPLSAFLIVPLLVRLAQLRIGLLYCICLLWLVDLYAITSEALRIADPFYRTVVMDFLRVLPPPGQLSRPIVMTERLSFVAPDAMAFKGDRYHRITNLLDDQIRLLYGYDRSQMIRFRDRRALHMGMFTPGSILIFVNDVAARVPPIRADNKTTLHDDFVQLIAVAEEIHLLRHGDRYQEAVASPQPVLLLHARGVVADPLTSFGDFAASDLQRVLGQEFTGPQVRIVGLRIQALCDIGGCRSFP